jgi:hypothetical protein
LEKIAKIVHLSLLSPNSRYGNVSVFAKKKDCWESIKRLNFDNIKIDSSYFINKEDYTNTEIDDINGKKFDEVLDKEIFVYKTNYKVWARLRDFYSNEGMSDFKVRTLSKYSVENKHIPTTNESNTLYKLYIEAKQNGFSE